MPSKKENAVTVPALPSDGRLLTAKIVEPRGRDLLSLRPIRRFMVSPLYPGIFQGFSLVVFGLVVYFGLLGTIRPAYNFATAITWTIWWPLLPLSFLLVGRAWCAVCPIVPGMSLVHRVIHPGRMPGQILRRDGVWLMGLGFVSLTWADRVWNITGSPRATAFLLLSLLGAALVMAVLYKGRAFCRYLCPIGALSGLYSMTAVTELRSKGPISCQGCGKECFRGDGAVEGCPLYQYVRTMDTNRNCNLCAQCVKSCPQGAVELRLRPPGRELWRLRAPLTGEALLVLLLVGMVYIQTVDMTTAWASYMQWFLDSTPVNSYQDGFTLTFVAALILAAGTYLLVTRWSGTGASWGRNFAAFGYAYIPLALAVHLGHNSIHLLAEGPSAVLTAARSLAAPLGIAATTSAQAGMPQLSLVWMVPLVILGGSGSLYVAWRISKRMEAQGEGGKLFPHLIFLLVLTALFVQLFLFPMNLRHAH